MHLGQTGGKEQERSCRTCKTAQVVDTKSTRETTRMKAQDRNDGLRTNPGRRRLSSRTPVAVKFLTSFTVDIYWWICIQSFIPKAKWSCFETGKRDQTSTWGTKISLNDYVMSIPSSRHPFLLRKRKPQKALRTRKPLTYQALEMWRASSFCLDPVLVSVTSAMPRTRSDLRSDQNMGHNQKGRLMAMDESSHDFDPLNKTFEKRHQKKSKTSTVQILVNFWRPRFEEASLELFHNRDFLSWCAVHSWRTPARGCAKWKNWGCKTMHGLFTFCTTCLSKTPDHTGTTCC